jgi:hypothetical protein
MRILEGQIRAAVEGSDVVDLSVTPSYTFDVPQPLSSLHILAVSAEEGTIVYESIANTGPAGG